MLHRFPLEVPYFTQPEIEALAGRPADSVRECLDRLVRLLPLLGDELVPVWTAEPLPSQPVATVAFRTKTSFPLVAVACESGLLAVAPAAMGRPWSFLQLPGVGPRQRSVRGLWASGGLRLFGPWTELLVLLAPEGRSEEMPRISRALVQVDPEGKVRLEPALEEVAYHGETRRPWEPVLLPASAALLTEGWVACSGGVDAFSLIGGGSLPYRKTIGNLAGRGDFQLAFGGEGLAWVTAEGQLCGQVSPNDPVIPISLEGEVHALTCIPCEPGRMRVALATDPYRLDAYELNRGVWERQPTHSLRSPARAVDWLAGDDRAGHWPDLVLATDAREFVRLRHHGSHTLKKAWEAEVERLADLAGLTTGADWIQLCRQTLEAPESAADDMRGRALRRTLHYLAVDRVLPWSAEESLHGKVAELWRGEREAGLLLPAARRFQEALAEWEQQGENGFAGVPELSKTCYDTKLFRVQEVFDAFLRSVSEEKRERLGQDSKGYQFLADNAANVVAFYDPPQLERRSGMQIYRAVERFVTAGFHLPTDADSFSYRFLIPLPSADGRPHFAALAGSRIDFYVLRRDLTKSKQTFCFFDRRGSLPIAPPFSPTFAAVVVSLPGVPFLLVGSHQGTLVSLSLSGIPRELARLEFGGSLLTAACRQPPGGGLPVEVWISRAARDGAEIVPLQLDGHGRMITSPARKTPLRQIQALWVPGEGQGERLLAGQGGDLVVLAALGTGGELEERGRLSFGSRVLHVEKFAGSLLDFACFTQNGEVFGLSLDPALADWQRVRWVLHGERGIVQTVPGLGAKEWAGLASGRGQVVLWDRDGNVRFHHAPERRAVAAALVSGVATKDDLNEYLVMAHESWGLSALVEAPTNQDSLDRARKALPAASLPGLLNDDPMAEISVVLELYDRGEKALEDIYREVRFSTSRRALVWLAAVSGAAGERAGGLLDKATPDDLVEFLRELPVAPLPSWAAPVWRRLEGEHGPGGNRQIHTELLYELLRRKPAREALLLPAASFRRLLQNELLEDEWASFLVALERVREAGEAGWEPPAGLARLVSLLSPFPLSVARAAAPLVTGLEREAGPGAALAAFVRLGDCLGRKARAEEVEAALRILAAALEPYLPGQSKAAPPRPERGLAESIRLFARYAFLLVAERQHGKKRPREEWEEIVALLGDIRERTGGEALDRLLFVRARKWLPTWAPPGPAAPLAAQESWLRELHQSLERWEEQRAGERWGFDKAFEVDPAWRELFEELLTRGKQRLFDRLLAEQEALRSRPHLHIQVVDTRRLSRFEVEAELLLRAEALGRVENLRYTVDLGGGGGFEAGRGPLTFKGEFPVIEPERLEPPESWRVGGTVPPAQTELRARVSLTWGPAGRSNEYVIPIPIRRATVGPREGKPPFPEALATWTKALGDQITGGKSACTFVLLDEELGRSGLVERCATPGSRVIDLDFALREVGPGHSYPKLLTLPHVRAALRGETVPGGADLARGDLGSGELLLVHRSDGFWHLLLSVPELASLAEEMVTWLLGRRRQKPGLVFFVAGELGGRLRRLFRERVKFVAAHRLPETEGAEWVEAAAWLMDVTGVPDENRGKAALRALGGDLRLASLLRNQLRQRAVFPGDLQRLAGETLRSAEALSVLQNDLAGLSPAAIPLFLLAAVSTSSLRAGQVQTGMVAAEEFLSTGKTKKTRQKKIVGIRERIDRRAAPAILSDSKNQERGLKVEGYSSLGGVEVPPAFGPLQTLLSGKEDVERQSLELERHGVAEVVAGVIRALPPWTLLVGRWVEEQLSPGEVHRRLTAGASPLAGLSLHELQRLNPRTLRQLEPELESTQAELLYLLGSIWRAWLEGRDPSPTDLLRCVRSITGFEAQLLAAGSQGEGPWVGHLESPKDLLVGIGAEGRPSFYCLFLPALGEAGAARRPSPGLLAAVDQAGGVGKGSRGRLIVFRPGQPSAPSSESWTEFSDGDLHAVLLERSWPRACLGRLRALAGLIALAPFQPQGALPPGSPVFFGREMEIEYICRHIREQSFLLLGSRQIGKTSLHNRIRRELADRGDLELLAVDLQGRESGEVLSRALERLAPQESGPAASPSALIDRLVAGAWERGKLPIFFFNEIDMILQSDPDFLRLLRGFHDSARARFLMTGYLQAGSAQGDPHSPLYHWTSSPDGRGFFVLGELGDAAAEEIIGLLEKPPLALEWESEAEKQRGVQLMIERSYRIPHLLQSICLQLIRQLDERKAYKLRARDVELAIRGTGSSAWDHVQRIQLGKFIPQIKPEEKGRLLAELLLLTAVKRLYYQGAAPAIRDPHLRQRDPRTLSFEATDLRRWFPEVLRSLLLTREIENAEQLLAQANLDDLLQGCSLTLILAFDPAAESRRFYFQSHLYPLETQRQLKPGESIDRPIIDRMLGLYPFLTGKEGGTPA